MRNIEIESGEYYHVYNRGVERRRVFLKPEHFERFYQSLAMFNDVSYKHHGCQTFKESVESYRSLGTVERRFVDIVAFALIPNHFHFLLRQKEDGGIAKFLQKVQQGYTRFFNLSHGRTGCLFSSSYQAEHIDSDSHFEHMVRYIHLNPLDVGGLPWRLDDEKKTTYSEVIDYLSTYPWSSHHVYLSGKQSFPVVDLEHVNWLCNTPSDYERYLASWFDLPYLSYGKNAEPHTSQLSSAFTP